MSPDGRYLAMRVAARGHRARLAVLDLQTMQPDVAASFGDKDIGSVRWVNAKRLVFDLRQELTGPNRAEHGAGLFAVDADGSNFRQLVETCLRLVRGPEAGTPLLPWRNRLLRSQVPLSDDDVFVTAPEEVSKQKVDFFVLRRLNTRTGRATEVDTPLHAVDWTLDARGALRLVLTRVGVSHPGIDPKHMGLTDFVRDKAADGLDIPACITLPPGVALDGKPKHLPLVVLVHGGPWVRGTRWQWQDEVQFLATRGYAVLQSEFRGSTGFGSRHFKAGFRQWGQAMQRDLADGARWAIAQGIADPQRIAIAGASYGGYAALMGLLQAPICSVPASAGWPTPTRATAGASWRRGSTSGAGSSGSWPGIWHRAERARPRPHAARRQGQPGRWAADNPGQCLGTFNGTCP